MINFSSSRIGYENKREYFMKTVILKFCIMSYCAFFAQNRKSYIQLCACFIFETTEYISFEFVSGGSAQNIVRRIYFHSYWPSTSLAN
jgi:hypothetical protein